MIQTQKINNPQMELKTIGEKLTSVLQQPLLTFTFTFPDRKKPEPLETVKADEHKKAAEKHQTRPVMVKTQRKSLPVQNTVLKRRAEAKVFTKTRNPQEYEKILFVLRACDKRSYRTFTEVLHVERTKSGTYLVATDGKHLHYAKIKGTLRPGDYKPMITKDAICFGKPVENVNFPNWQKVIPVNIVKRGCLNLLNTTAGNIDQVCNSFTKMTGEKVNPDYLASLTKRPWVVYCQKEKHKAVLLKEYDASRETYAVIMPLS